jgi:hypothetical protein
MWFPKTLVNLVSETVAGREGGLKTCYYGTLLRSGDSAATISHHDRKNSSEAIALG